MGIECEFDYCIYNKGGVICILKEIRMNCIGMCENLITLQFSQEELEEHKQSQLQKRINKFGKL
ncbi:MAG: hypothetical protein FWE91_12155 [Defluviitaleaceae bacterium]|nr:hypothetical protein [Defluviitaleaceae bacterium]MCL2836504.1 hypothetical protein [Defluviitaleaceae bacterium]